jgi:hypothetical protein
MMTPSRGLVNVLPQMAQRIQIWREITGVGVEPDVMAHDFGRQTMMLTIVRKGWEFIRRISHTRPRLYRRAFKMAPFSPAVWLVRSNQHVQPYTTWATLGQSWASRTIAAAEPSPAVYSCAAACCDPARL